MKDSPAMSQGGYTLVELIIATAIGTLVLGAMASIVLTTATGANVAMSHMDASSQIRTFQINAYDDVAFSSLPAPSGCGTQGNPCTTQALLLQGLRMPNQPLPGQAPTQTSVTYSWDPTQHLVTRQIGDGVARTVASNVTSYSWYIDSNGAHPSLVIALTVTEVNYNATFTEVQTFRFNPQVSSL
jgi:type II secretory pathway pseudopilin PulG